MMAGRRKDGCVCQLWKRSSGSRRRKRGAPPRGWWESSSRTWPGESAELLDKDLDIPEMSIQQAEKKIKAYADAHKTGSFACVTPVEAERILREFYGLTAGENPSDRFAATSPVRGGKGDSEIIDLGAFL